MTQRFESIATLENEIEAICLKGELEERGVPHAIQSNYDSAYDGLFQASRGWGYVAAPAEHRANVLQVLNAIRQRAGEADDAAEVGQRDGSPQPED